MGDYGQRYHRGQLSEFGTGSHSRAHYGTALQCSAGLSCGSQPRECPLAGHAYEEAGYLQLAALYRELAQERRETPKAIQFQAPKPPGTPEELKQPPPEPPDRKTIPLPSRSHTQPHRHPLRISRLGFTSPPPLTPKASAGKRPFDLRPRSLPLPLNNRRRGVTICRFNTRRI